MTHRRPHRLFLAFLTLLAFGLCVLAAQLPESEGRLDSAKLPATTAPTEPVPRWMPTGWDADAIASTQSTMASCPYEEAAARAMPARQVTTPVDEADTLPIIAPRSQRALSALID